MTVLNIVTAVSRPGNLCKLLDSIEATVQGSGLDVNWIVVFDSPVDAPVEFQTRIDAARGLRIRKAFWLDGPCRFGILQKNLGIDLCDHGFYYLLDDDNVLHPAFLGAIGKLIRLHPAKLAFAFNQIRWDHHGNLPARPERMVPDQIDNSMFVVHTDLIGGERYDIQRAGQEDGFFFQGLYGRMPEAFLFVDEYLTYYNYLVHFPEGPEPTSGR